MDAANASAHQSGGTGAGSESPQEKRKTMAELRQMWEGRSSKDEAPPRHGSVRGGMTMTKKRLQQSASEAKPAAITSPSAAATLSNGKLGSPDEGFNSPRTSGEIRSTGVKLASDKHNGASVETATHHLLEEQNSFKRNDVDSVKRNDGLSLKRDGVDSFKRNDVDSFKHDNVDSFKRNEDSFKHDDVVHPPVVLRGSLLVQNSRDMLRWPRLMDAVETSDSDEGIVVEENTNLFHGRYHQARQNPMYFSDHEDDGEGEPGVSRKRGKGGRGAAGPAPDAGKATAGHQRPKITQKWNEDSAAGGNAPISDRIIKIDGQNRTEILRLVDGSSSDSIRQTVTVERTDEELSKEASDALMREQANEVVNVDVIQESVDVELSNGVARVKVTVQCEKIVPNRAVKDKFQKSCVKVTRLTEIDMLATPQRRQVYGHLVSRFTAPDEASKGALVQRNRLGVNDIYGLYTVFMQVIEDSGSAVDTVDDTLQRLGNSSASGDHGNELHLLRRQSIPLSLLRLGQQLMQQSSV